MIKNDQNPWKQVYTTFATKKAPGIERRRLKTCSDRKLMKPVATRGITCSMGMKKPGALEKG